MKTPLFILLQATGGIRNEVNTFLSDYAVPVIAMVSCNPVTFARDARVLVQAGYRLDWVQAVDQFRWSAHVELAARFSR